MTRRLLAMVLAVGAALGAGADTETVDGIVWNYAVSDGNAEVGIGGYSGTRAVSTSTTDAIIGSFLFEGWTATAKNASADKVAYKDGAAVRNLVKTQGDTAHIYAVWHEM